MSTITLRKELQEYLNNADERFIQLVYGMMQADKSNDFLLSESERKKLDKRIARHKKGESKSYSWEEVKARLQG
ncbi:addiction module protein [Marivirga arenosa]|uniref:Addiction module protein n=1 Tax=Marivirga arenosa TaxID=3059076 RepID=A0AA49GCR3_9BACT|nr:addiction module protein [Marivirga sp. BKB1-2]WKK80436.2 addiction module protein [Marivirga sp. BKB1-2]